MNLNFRKAQREKLYKWMDKGFIQNVSGIDKYRKNKVILKPLNLNQDFVTFDNVGDSHEQMMRDERFTPHKELFPQYRSHFDQ